MEQIAIDAKQAYASWAEQYDSNKNNTRDVEAVAMRNELANISFNKCLEIGCGTGKNTVWLAQKSQHVTAVDLSEVMLAKAKEKVQADWVEFEQEDIRNNWNFNADFYDLITFNLVLEHIENLDHIFSEAAKILQPGGHIYIGELHPFKQYLGTKARFDTEYGQQVVECYNHHVSDFVQVAKRYGVTLIDVNEYFDDDDRNTVPRILTISFRKA